MVGGMEFFLLVLEMAASFVVHFCAADMTSFLPTGAQKHAYISTHLQTPPDTDLPQRSGRTRFACSDARVHRCMSCYVTAMQNVFLKVP